VISRDFPSREFPGTNPSSFASCWYRSTRCT
jgi:hypothetical protein